MMPMRRLLFLCAAFAALLACPLARAAGQAVNGWQAVLVAGDDAEPVFDNAVAAIDRWLLSVGVPQSGIRRLSARSAEPSVEPATDARVLAAVAALRPQPGQGCFVFITSHGTPDEGVYLARDRGFLWPPRLAAALSDGCRDAPTVVVVSACYSGSFAQGAMRAPNRIVLTAARADRPSFGCQAGRNYTVFDECLIAALPRVPSWRVVYRETRACVEANERRLRVLPSRPQAFFGAAVHGLRVR